MNFAVGITVFPSSSLNPFPALFMISSTSACEEGGMRDKEGREGGMIVVMEERGGRREDVR
jgi:hypothetical protein